MPLLTAQRMVTQIKPEFFTRALQPCLKAILSWSAEGEDGILGELGKKTDGIAQAVEIMAMTINIQGTLSGVGANIGIMMGANAIPTESADRYMLIVDHI